MVAALRAYHGEIKATIYPEAGHDSWTQTYDNPALYDWLLQQEKTEPVLIRPAGGQLSASSGKAAAAFDGNFGTRWESDWTDSQWLMIDLEKPVPLKQWVIFWEYAYATSYDIQCSPDGENWITVRSESASDGAVDLILFPEGFETRFLKLVLKKRSSQWGYSIWDMELE